MRKEVEASVNPNPTPTLHQPYIDPTPLFVNLICIFICINKKRLTTSKSILRKRASLSRKIEPV